MATDAIEIEGGPGGSDPQLLRAWSAGDGAAGNELVRRHFTSLHSFFCLRVASTEAVDDLTHQVFLACLEQPERFAERGSFKAYLFGIARKQLLMHFRNGHRGQPDAGHEIDTIVAATITPSALVATNEERTLLIHALRRLPLDLQIALELFYWERMRTVDIAEVLETEHATIRTRLSRARAMLRDRIAELGDHPELVRSTVRSFETWARSVRAKRPPA